MLPLPYGYLERECLYGREEIGGDLFVCLFAVSHYFHCIFIIVFIDEDSYFLSDVVRCQSCEPTSVFQDRFYSIAFEQSFDELCFPRRTGEDKYNKKNLDKVVLPIDYSKVIRCTVMFSLRNMEADSINLSSASVV